MFISFDVKAQASTKSSPYLDAVKTFADNVLTQGKDTYGDVHSSLFVDGINVRTREPVRWGYDDQSWIISNFGSQQNLMRTLVGLSELTGDKAYRKAGEAAVKEMFANHSDETGLLYWGGHQFVDLETMENQFKGRPHELKNNYPFYEFMWEVDSAATRKMLHAMWNAHILEWEKLDLNRHGEYDLEMGPLWEHKFHHPKPFFEGEGLTFINAGTDMIQSALSLYLLGGEDKAKTWGIRLYKQYVQARHPNTGLGVYQYSQPKRHEMPPAEGPLTGELTFSRYGDRAANQFGEVYGDVALEGNVLWGGRMETLYGRSPVMLLYLAEKLEGTEAGDYLLNHSLEGLIAYTQQAYVPEENHFKPMWADGTDLTGKLMPRTGYYGKKGTPFRAFEPTGPVILAAAKAVRLSGGNSALWQKVRHMFINEGLGDPGVEYGEQPDLNMGTEVSNATLLAAVLELHKSLDEPSFLELAERIGDNILSVKFHHGFFMDTANHKYAKFDRPEPVVLLMLEAARQGKPDIVPPYLTGYGSTDGEPEKGGRPTDETFYEETFK
ncbi:pectate lyase [Gracilimonas mengyeensis]|nr:pectate lyase [Gracilimonas mengyeensis]